MLISSIILNLTFGMLLQSKHFNPWFVYCITKSSFATFSISTTGFYIKCLMAIDVALEHGISTLILIVAST